MAIVDKDGNVLAILPADATEDEIYAEMRRLAELYGD